MIVEALKTLHAKGSSKPTRTPPSRVENTRNTILDAAVNLYKTRGIDATTISLVIEKSTVGRTTFYRHFKDRDDVLNHALTRDFQALMEDFKSASRHYQSLEMQIEEDMIWFLKQFEHRPALSLLFSDVQWQRYEQARNSLMSFRQASIACATPTYERAVLEGRLRKGISLDMYIDWSSFVVVSMQVIELPTSENLIRSREMVRNFLVPSLIRMNDQSSN